MTELQNSTEKKIIAQGTKKSEWVYIILLLLLLGMNGLFGWLWWSEKGRLQIITIEKGSVEKDAEIVKQELIALQAQYANLEVNNKSMKAEIDAKKEEITQLQKELEKNKDNAYIIAKLKKETQTLRTIMQHFVHEIDSLNTLNKNVIADREKVKGELKVEKEKNTQLSKEKEGLQQTVKIASLLKTVSLSAIGIKEKRGGKKEQESNKAKRSDKIRIKFTLAENKVAANGERNIYVRIVTPDGKELTQSEDSAHVFSFGGSRGYWASKKSVNYFNEETNVVMYAHPMQGKEFVNGKYIIEVNSDNVTIGSTTLELE